MYVAHSREVFGGLAVARCTQLRRHLHESHGVGHFSSCLLVVKFENRCIGMFMKHALAGSEEGHACNLFLSGMCVALYYIVLSVAFVANPSQ